MGLVGAARAVPAARIVERKDEVCMLDVLMIGSSRLDVSGCGWQTIEGLNGFSLVGRIVVPCCERGWV